MLSLKSLPLECYVEILTQDSTSNTLLRILELLFRSVNEWELHFQVCLSQPSFSMLIWHKVELEKELKVYYRFLKDSTTLK